MSPDDKAPAKERQVGTAASHWRSSFIPVPVENWWGPVEDLHLGVTKWWEALAHGALHRHRGEGVSVPLLPSHYHFLLPAPALPPANRPHPTNTDSWLGALGRSVDEGEYRVSGVLWGFPGKMSSTVSFKIPLLLKSSINKNNLQFLKYFVTTTFVMGKHIL